ncbi:hypothetical protein GGR53DRAFT_265839 [Hypoxylon sp. FL1150]|nr:hypothetical protein GGR53DRAFT_265839 [Hypoxylon sp. FL1150]
MSPIVEGMSDGDVVTRNDISTYNEQSRDLSQELESLFGAPSESTGSSSPEATPPHQDHPAYGLQWSSDDNLFLETPKWVVEPTIDSIISTLKQVIGPHEQYIVEHSWDGVYNKIYHVSYNQSRLVMRVTLPVCPRLKTESEVATLRWIDDNTRLPVPKVRYYDSSRDNPLGFEWILMDRMEGIPLSRCWDTTSQGAKTRIVKQVAAYAAVAFKQQFRGIGSLYLSIPNNPDTAPRLGEMVSMALF